MPEDAIDRREAIRRVSAMLGGVALVGGSGLWTACENHHSGTSAASADGAAGAAGAFSAADVAFLDEVADTILPETSTPGAKAARVGAFMAVMVTDCYEARDQEIFRQGMRQLDEASRTANHSSFTAATSAARLALLQSVDREQKAYMDAKTADAPSHYFRMMKELALLGYFTSEIGCTKAQRYVESPGRFDPCVPYTAHAPAWAAHG